MSGCLVEPCVSCVMRAFLPRVFLVCMCVCVCVFVFACTCSRGEACRIRGLRFGTSKRRLWIEIHTQRFAVSGYNKYNALYSFDYNRPSIRYGTIAWPPPTSIRDLKSPVNEETRVRVSSRRRRSPIFRYPTLGRASTASLPTMKSLSAERLVGRLVPNGGG